MPRNSASRGPSRRLMVGALASIVVLFQARQGFAQDAGSVTDIIKSLAPIAGQASTAGGAGGEEPIVIEKRTIRVDTRRHVELEVFFEFDSDRITPPAQSQLEPLGEALASDDLRPFNYLIAGHTDAVGLPAYNLDLSRRRARAVFEYLVQSFAIDPDRLMTVGFGSSRLRSPDHPTAAINRRVEILLIVS